MEKDVGTTAEGERDVGRGSASDCLCLLTRIFGDAQNGMLSSDIWQKARRREVGGRAAEVHDGAAAEAAGRAAAGRGER